MIFDIETTGLSAKTDFVILIGFIVFKETTAYIHQIFAEQTDEEFEVLQSFFTYAKDTSIFVTFNGSSFDIPFINKRLHKYHHDFRIHKSQSFDLYRICKSSKLDVPNFKLKTLETYLNISREDTISGRESVLLYHEYTSNPTQKTKDIILKHNFEDILHLIPFTKILDCLSLNYKAFKVHHLLIHGYKFYLNQFSIKNDFLTITFTMANPSLYKSKIMDYYDVFTLKLFQGTLEISLPIMTLIGPDSTTYSFIDSEKLGWHKDFNELSLHAKKQLLVKENHLYYNQEAVSFTSRIIQDFL